MSKRRRVLFFFGNQKKASRLEATTASQIKKNGDGALLLTSLDLDDLLFVTKTKKIKGSAGENPAGRCTCPCFTRRPCRSVSSFIIYFIGFALLLFFALASSLTLSTNQPRASNPQKKTKKNFPPSPPRPQRPRQARGPGPRLLLGRDGGAGPRRDHYEQAREEAFFFRFRFSFVSLWLRGRKKKTSLFPVAHSF